MMYVKHYISKALMNHSSIENEPIVEVAQVLGQTCSMLFWELWHTSSNRIDLDSGKIYLKNLAFYKSYKMSVKDCIKANKITLKVYESFVDGGLYVQNSKLKNYYSILQDRYYEMIELPEVKTIIYNDMKRKRYQQIRIRLTGTQLKKIENDSYLTELNQQIASIDANLTAKKPVIKGDWLIYQLKDQALNFRIKFGDKKIDNSNNYLIYLDGEHIWDMRHEFGALIGGSSGTGKTALLFGILDQLLVKKNVEVYIADGKNDQLSALGDALLPSKNVYSGSEVYKLIHKLKQETDDRYWLMKNQRANNHDMIFADFDDFGLKLKIIILDEQALVIKSLDKVKREQYINDLLAIAQGARGAGIVPLIVLQQASADFFGGSKGTAIRNQLTGLNVLMGRKSQIRSNDRVMIFGQDSDLPDEKFDEKEVGVGFVRTSSMQAIEAFRTPLLPVKDDKLDNNKILNTLINDVNQNKLYK